MFEAGRSGEAAPNQADLPHFTQDDAFDPQPLHR